VQVPSEGLQKICGGGEAAQAVFGHEAAQQSEKPEGLLWLGGCFRQAFGNRLEDAFEPFRLNAAENMLPEDQVAYGANRLRSADLIDDFVQNIITRRQHTARKFQYAAVMELLQNLVCCQHSFGVFLRSVLEARVQLSTRIAGRDF
jgi:hypothetical protein